MAMVNCLYCDTWQCTHEIDEYNTIGGHFVCQECYSETSIDTGEATKMDITSQYDIGMLFEDMTEGERCHMANKLYKEGYLAIKAQQGLDELLRELEILEGACDFWKQEAIDRGDEE